MGTGLVQSHSDSLPNYARASYAVAQNTSLRTVIELGPGRTHSVRRVDAVARAVPRRITVSGEGVDSAHAGRPTFARSLVG